MQRYLPHAADHSQIHPCVSGGLAPYFVQLASLLVSVSAADTEELGKAAMSGRANVRSCRQGGTLRDGRLHLLLDFGNLVSGASGIAASGCGSLKSPDDVLRSPMENSSMFSRTAGSSRVSDSKEVVAGAGGDREEYTSTRSVMANATAREAAVPPRCLQFVTLRYRHELIMGFSIFQQLLHLFMEYMVQCRQAYEHQRLQSGFADDDPGSSALGTPDFCDFGYRLKLQELGDGGIALEFLSLIAIHDGREQLSIQWADAVSLQPRVICTTL